MKSESRIVKKILDWLNDLDGGVKAIKIHGSQFMEAGTPDILCCMDGVIYWFEVKTEKGSVSKIQEKRIDEWREAGAKCHVVRSLADVQEIITEVV